MYMSHEGDGIHKRRTITQYTFHDNELRSTDTTASARHQTTLYTINNKLIERGNESVRSDLGAVLFFVHFSAQRLTLS